MEDDMAPDAQYVPHELVWGILLLLPVESLIRFTCVCKTWHSTITGDESFRRSHHRLQEPCMLIAPRIKIDDDGPSRTTKYTKVAIPGLYRWKKSQGAATLVQALDSFPPEVARPRHRFAHCDGLVLMPMDDTVRVLNPATRRVLTLPETEIPHSVLPNRRRWLFQGAFGLGHDPCSNTYKVARFFYRDVDLSGRHYTLGMEVFTIGRDRHWRETAAAPPYPIIAGQTATFFKGSLLWTIDESLLKDEDFGVRGFLRFNLEDESFSVTPAPPGCPKLRDMASNLAEIGGELYLDHEGPKHMSLHPIWACGDVDGAGPPRWVQHHVIMVGGAIHMIAAIDDGIMFQWGSERLFCFDSRSSRGFRHVASMNDLRYHHPDTNTYVEYTREIVHAYDVIPYVPSLVPI